MGSRRDLRAFLRDLRAFLRELRAFLRDVTVMWALGFVYVLGVAEEVGFASVFA